MIDELECSLPQIDPKQPTLTEPSNVIHSGVFKKTLKFIIVPLLLIAIFLVLSFNSGRSRVLERLPQRGFADTVLKYKKKDYTGAKWTEVYSNSFLRPENAYFEGVRGWDDDNFLIFGTKGGGPLLICFQRGMKSKPYGYPEGPGRGVTFREAHYIDVNDLVISYEIPHTFNDVALVKKNLEGGEQRLGTINAAGGFSCIAPDIILSAERINGNSGGGNWRFYEGRFFRDDENSQGTLVRDANGGFARCGNNKSMDICYISSIAVISPGNAVGLWQKYNDSSVGVVKYKNKQWTLIQSVEHLSENGVDGNYKAWFIDDGNGVIVGADKAIVITNGTVTQFGLQIGGKPVSGTKLIVAWGERLDNFYAMDNRGNVFRFNGSDGVCVVRGPDFRDERQVQDKIKFLHSWVSPTGLVFAITDEKLYKLE